jgi:hypothetical protein
LLAAAPAGAGEIQGVNFAERVRFADRTLQLHGTGLLRYRIFIKGYVAALYLGVSFDGEATSETVLADIPRRLEIEYFWPIRAEQFAEITLEGTARGVDPATFEQLRNRIERINALYADVEPGDRYALSYAPGVGTELALNGRRLGVIEGNDFSAALFGVWLGDESLDDSLRRQLLNRN